MCTIRSTTALASGYTAGTTGSTRDCDEVGYGDRENVCNKSEKRKRPLFGFSTHTHTHTHTHTQPFYGSLDFVWDYADEPVPKKHSPTHIYSILIINQSLSASSIYCDPWHPPCSVYMPDSLSARSLSNKALKNVKNVCTLLQTNQTEQSLTVRYNNNNYYYIHLTASFPGQEARDDGVAMASAGPNANHLNFTPDR